MLKFLIPIAAMLLPLPLLADSLIWHSPTKTSIPDEEYTIKMDAALLSDRTAIIRVIAFDRTCNEEGYFGQSIHEISGVLVKFDKHCLNAGSAETGDVSVIVLKPSTDAGMNHLISELKTEDWVVSDDFYIDANGFTKAWNSIGAI